MEGNSKTEMNVPLSDESLEQAVGGWNKDWWKKYSNTKPKIENGWTVKRKGYERFGTAKVYNIDYFGRKNEGMFVYDIAYTNGGIDSGYGHNVPEIELYKA